MTGPAADGEGSARPASGPQWQLEHLAGHVLQACEWSSSDMAQALASGHAALIAEEALRERLKLNSANTFDVTALEAHDLLYAVEQAQDMLCLSVSSPEDVTPELERLLEQSRRLDALRLKLRARYTELRNARSSSVVGQQRD